MKKYIYVMCIFLLIVINFTGCKSINTNNPADVSVDYDEKSNEDSNEDKDEDMSEDSNEDMSEDSNEDKNKDMNEQSTDISENNLIPLEEATPEQLSLININKIINGHQISFNLGDTNISSNSAYFN